MPVLIDTSVWRGFFKGNSAFRALRDQLDEDGAVLMHPFVLGELVMGGLSQKEENLFAQLPVVALVPHDEVLGEQVLIALDQFRVRRVRAAINDHFVVRRVICSAVIAGLVLA